MGGLNGMTSYQRTFDMLGTLRLFGYPRDLWI